MTAQPDDSSARQGPATLEDPFYYLHNFRWVLRWVVERYSDLLSDSELEFVAQFQTLPTASQGLLVRMVMRKGETFRGDKLRYRELGPTENAMQALLAKGWVSQHPSLDLHTLFRLFTWSELSGLFADKLALAGLTTARKGEALAVLEDLDWGERTPAEWGLSKAAVYHCNVMGLCDRFRLMFFGNLQQDWSEFVLTELGTFCYEPVVYETNACESASSTESARPFASRAEIDAYLELSACHESFQMGDGLADILDRLPRLPSDNPWLVRSRDRLLFKLAREWERAGELGLAAELYRQCGHPEARCRLLRVLECAGEFELALTLAHKLDGNPLSEAEAQYARRVRPRLRRKLGHPPGPREKPVAVTETLQLELPAAPSVETAVAEHLSEPDAPVFYVENTLLTGLFGLLCWEAIFAPVPAAFFHPFQQGPADLHWPGFYRRRQKLFDACLQRLDSGDYHQVVREIFTRKSGVQSPFVNWAVLTEELLDLALQLIPARHLRAVFERLLQDIKANRAGLPDLIQFWPEQGRYRMIEVKGPGDRVQDNQRRWLDHFATHEIPAIVCHVKWQQYDELLA